MNGVKQITRTSSIGFAAILLMAVGLSGCIVEGRGGYYGGHQDWHHNWDDDGQGGGWQGGGWQGGGGGWQGGGNGHHHY